MKITGFLCAAAPALLAAGCAQPQRSAPFDFDGTLGTGSAEHWEVLHDSHGTVTAEIVTPARDAYVDVACAEDNLLTFIVSFTVPTSSAAANRKLSLAFDDAAPVPYPMLPMDENVRESAFGTYARWPAFWRAVAALKQHRSVEVIADTGNDIVKRRMTLDGAAPAIDQILAACGNPRPPSS
jgi:hypothetical protein